MSEKPRVGPQGPDDPYAKNYDRVFDQQQFCWCGHRKKCHDPHDGDCSMEGCPCMEFKKED